MSGDPPPPAAVVGAKASKIPTPGGSPSTRVGKSSIPSPARNSSQHADARRSKSILSLASPEASPYQDVHAAAPDQIDKAKQRRFSVPSLNLSRSRALLETTEDRAAPLASPTAASHTPVSIFRHSTTQAAQTRQSSSMDALHSPSDASKMKKLSKSTNLATKVVFGRALISPRSHRPASKVVQSSSSSTPADPPPADRADRLRQSRCTSAIKSREPAMQKSEQLPRSISVDKSRSSISRSISVEKSRLTPAKPGAGDSKFRHSSPSMARRPPAEAKASVPSASKPSLLSAILEAPRPLSGLKPIAPATANVNPRPIKPSFSLNLSSIKQQQTAVEHSFEGPLSGSSSMASQVPKLNLTPLLQQREEEHGAHASYKVSSTMSSGGSKSQVDEPVDHFYYYPKLDPKEERRAMGIISKYLPAQPGSYIKNVFGSMVEAKQNCEAIAFRGHRLLDQLNSHMKEKLNEERKGKEEERKAKEEERKAKEEERKAKEELSDKLEEERKANEELIEKLRDFQRSSEEQQQRMDRLVKEVQKAGIQGNKVLEELVANCSGAQEPATDGEMTEAAALQNLKSMSDQLSQVQDSVRLVSSRWGGVAVPYAKTSTGAAKQKAAAVEQAVSGGKDSLKDSKADQGTAKQLRSGAGLQSEDDDRIQVQDVDGSAC